MWSLETTIALIALGGYTRGSGSGYGCRDRWPLCEDGLLGGLLPRLEYHMIVEWTHRWVAAIVGILILLTAVAAWRARTRNWLVAWMATSAVFVVGLQAWLGRMIVKGDLDRDLVALHLSVSMAIVGLLTLVVVITGPRLEPGTKGWRLATVIAAIATYGVLLLGSMVHDMYFPGWPVMEAGLIPDTANGDAVLHFIHRLAAGIGFLYLLVLAVRARRRLRPERTLLAVSTAAFAVNVILGAVHVFTEVSSAAVVATHLLFAAVAWASAVGATGMAWGVARASQES